MVLWRPTRLSRTNTQKDLLFIIGDWNAKVGSQETPGVTGKFGLGIQNKAGQRQIEFCQENALVIANTLFQQHKRSLYTWTSLDGQHRTQIDYILYSQRWRSSIQSTKKDQKLTVAQIMNSLLPNSDLNWRKQRKPLDDSGMTDLNQIPYDYTVEVRNRFKGLDLVDRVPDELWMEVRDIVQETGIKTIPMEKKMQKSKMAVWGGLTNSCEKKRSKKQSRKGKIYSFECRVPKNSKER